MFNNKVSSIIVALVISSLLLQLMMLSRTSCTVSWVSDVRSRRQHLLAAEGGALNWTSLSASQRNLTPLPPAEFPALQNGRKRRLTIGIPTVKRRDGSYFLTMLETMLNKTEPQYLDDVVFVVFLAENNNTDWKLDMEKYLKQKYQLYVDRGSLIVVQAPLTFYETMPDFGDNNYMIWRTKQNFDYAYMMKYSRDLSEYYMQMEDDVTTSNNYYPAILRYIEECKNLTWVCLEFSELGFIGKLYRSKDLVHLADMLLMFNSTAPVDYTFLYFNHLSGQTWRLLRKPTLFQHLGVQSSLADKIQPLRDKFFDFPEKEIHGHNPPANIYTSFKISPDFPPDLAYRKVPGHFWSEASAQLNDYFTVVFNNPQRLTRVAIVTGGKDHPEDILHNAVVEMSPVKMNETECSDYVVIGEFHEGVANISEAAITQKMSAFKTCCMRIRVTSPQDQWVIIKEIAVFVKDFKMIP